MVTYELGRGYDSLDCYTFSCKGKRTVNTLNSMEYEAQVAVCSFLLLTFWPTTIPTIISHSSEIYNSCTAIIRTLLGLGNKSLQLISALSSASSPIISALAFVATPWWRWVHMRECIYSLSSKELDASPFLFVEQSRPKLRWPLWNWSNVSLLRQQYLIPSSDQSI